MSNEENHSNDLEKAHDCVDSVTHYNLFELVKQFLQFQHS